MKILKLGEIGKIVTGCTPATKKSEYYESDDYMFVGPSDIKNVMYVVSSEKHISQKAYEDHKTRLINENSIVVDCIGSDMGNVAIVKEECLTNQQINAITNIDENNYNIRYVYYVLSTMKNYFHLIGTNGSTMPILNKSMFENIEIEVPDIEIQNKISNILSKLDDKIKLNNEINNNLYELIKNNYETLISNCDWEEVELGTIANITSGKRPIDKLEIGKYPVIGANGVMAYTSEFNFDEDLIITGRVGTLGVIKRYSEQIWASDNTLVVQTKYLNYIENYMKTIDYYSLNRGSTQPLLTQGDLKNQIIMFNEESVLKFEEENQIFINKIRNNEKETKYLEQLRDTLLPKLMNGEIDLDNIEI